MSLHTEYLSGIAEVDAEEWSGLVAAGDPFLNRDFLVALERHGAAGPDLGWRPYHVAARDDSGRLLGLMPLYIKSNSFGEFIYDWSWANAYRQAGLAYYPKLFTGLPYTPATGARFWIRPGEATDEVRRALIHAALELAKTRGWSSWHVAFPTADESSLLEQFDLLPRKDVQFHWHNRGYRDFAGFLATLSADKRRKLRAERRKVRDAGIEIERLHGGDVPPGLWPRLHALYADTFEKFGNHPAIPAACFAEIGHALGDRMVLFIASDDGVPVAVSICYRNDEALYGRYWGTSGRYDGLHFELCYYQGIDYCIDQGLARFEPGAGGEHKIARGFEPTPVTTMHWIADPRMREVLRAHLARVDQSVERYRAEAAEHLPFRKTGDG